MFRFDIGSVLECARSIRSAAHQLVVQPQAIVGTGAFTTSPALGAVAAQYASYLNGHPGSLVTATKAMTANIEFLHTTMTRMTEALQNQEKRSADTFYQEMMLSQLPEEYGVFIMPTRTHIPITDLGYLPPVAAVEATTPLTALVAMFSGDDSQILAASAAWTSSGSRMLAAVESLQRAASVLTATTEGAAFDTATVAIESTVAQGTVIAANATAMGQSMAQLPPIRAAAHARLITMEAEAQARKAAASAVGAADPTTAAVARAAAEAETQAEVAAFVSGFLQPALDTARPLVTNLGVDMVGHTGGGALGTGAAGTQAATLVATQVSGGVNATGQTAVVGQYGHSPQGPAQLAASTGQAAQAAQLGQSVTSPAGGTTPSGQTAAAAQIGQGAQRAGQFANSTASGTPTAALGQTGRAPVGGGQAGGTPGAQRVPSTTASAGGGGLGAQTPGAGTGAGTGTGATRVPGIPGGAGTRAPGGSVTQPMLPRALATPGYSTGGTGSSVGRTAGPGTPGNFTGGTGPGAGMIRAGAGGGPGWQATGGPGTAGQGTGGPGMMGGMGGAGAAGGAGRPGTGHGQASPFTAGAKNKSKKDLVKEYFRRQFLGEEPLTVKTVIR